MNRNDVMLRLIKFLPKKHSTITEDTYFSESITPQFDKINNNLLIEH